MHAPCMVLASTATTQPVVLMPRHLADVDWQSPLGLCGALMTAAHELGTDEVLERILADLPSLAPSNGSGAARPSASAARNTPPAPQPQLSQRRLMRPPPLQLPQNRPLLSLVRCRVIYSARTGVM